MRHRRLLVAFGIAWLSALLLSWWVYKQTTAPPSRQLDHAVAAARDLPVGARITAADLKLVALERKDLPQGAFLKISDVVDRAVTTPVAASELVLQSKLAADGSGEGLLALIEPGMRAVSVQVNDVSGVAGFVQPGTHVDVLFTYASSSSNASATTILQNVKVLAYGKQLEPGAPNQLESRTSASSRLTVATLLVTQVEAEKLALAVQRGKIQLALRNPLDSEVTEETEPVDSADLRIEEPRRNGPSRGVSPLRARPPEPSDGRPGTQPAASGASEQPVKPTNGVKPANDGRIRVRVYRGSKMSEEVFE